MSSSVSGMDRSLVDDFKLAMRRLAATITIVSAKNADQQHGMAATAVTSLTTDPPSLIACVNKSASIHGPIIESGGFCVNLLGSDHHHLVPVFSGKEKGPQRFATGNWQAGQLDIPYLVDAQASVFCKVDRQMSYGSHTIFVGAVQGIRISETISPLIYQDGKFFRTVALAP